MTPDSAPRSTSSQPGGRSRSGLKLAAALGAVALLAAIALVTRGAPQASSGPEARPAAAPGHPSGLAGASDADAKSGTGGPEEAQSAPRRFAATTCWQDLERFNDHVTLETFRDWAAPLLAAKDPLVVEIPQGAPGGAHRR